MKKYTIENLIKTYPKIYYQNRDFNSENFPPPKKVETKNWKLIKIPSGETWTSEKCLEEIKKAGCRPANVYELLLWSKDNQQKGTYVIALGSKWIEAERDHRVPGVSAHGGGGFSFHLGCFEEPWYDFYAILSFCDELLEPQTLKNSDSLILPAKLIINGITYRKDE